jgi:hypothetical protein
MKKGYQKEKVLTSSSKTVYVGIDVHKDSWHVTVQRDGEAGVINNLTFLTSLLVLICLI